MLIKNICRALLITSIFSTATIESHGKTEQTTSEKKGFFSKLKKHKTLELKKGKSRQKKAKKIEKKEFLKRAQKLEDLMHRIADQLVSMATKKTFEQPINLTRIDEFRILISEWICKIDTLRSRKELYKQQAYEEKTQAMLSDIKSNLDHNNKECLISGLVNHKQLIAMLTPHIGTLRDCSSLLMAKKTLQAMEKDVCKYADLIVSATEDENIALEDFVGIIQDVYNDDGTLKDTWEIYKKQNVATKLMNHQQQIAQTCGLANTDWKTVTRYFQQLLDEKSEKTSNRANSSTVEDLTSEHNEKEQKHVKQKKSDQQPLDDISQEKHDQSEHKEAHKPQTQQEHEIQDDDDFTPQEIDVSDLPEEGDDDIVELNPSQDKTPTKTLSPEQSKKRKTKKDKKKK